MCVCVYVEGIYILNSPSTTPIPMHTQDQKHLTHFLLHCSTWKWALLYPDCNMVTHLLCTWCLSSAYYMQDPEFPLPEARLYRVWYGFRHSHGWRCWVKWVSLLAVLVLAGGWGLGRSSMWVKLRNPAALQWQEFLRWPWCLCVWHTQSQSNLGPLRRLLLGFAYSDVWSGAQSFSWALLRQIK